MKPAQWLKTAVCTLGCLLLWGTAAQAHKVTVFAWVEGDMIHTESKFSGAKLVKNGKIEVYDPAGNKILEGNTDERGYFAFPVPKAQKLKVVLTAGMGHSNHWVVTADELGAADAASNSGTSAPEAQSTAPTSPVPAAAPPSSPDASSQPGLDAAALERIINRALDHKLAPLKAQLAEQPFGLRDLVAGFGYILGLMGLASYMHYRKTTRQIVDSSNA